MSDIGLHGSIYEQLRSYADRLDGALIALRNPQPRDAQAACREISGLLREVTATESTNPTARLVMVILKQRLPGGAGRGLALCEDLAAALEQHPPTASELAHLEEVAFTLDRECGSALARMTAR